MTGIADDFGNPVLTFLGGGNSIRRGRPGTPRRGALAVMRNDRISIRPHYRLSGRLSDKPQQTRREATVKHKTDVRRPGGPARFRCGSDPAGGYHALEDTDLKK